MFGFFSKKKDTESQKSPKISYADVERILEDLYHIKKWEMIDNALSLNEVNKDDIVKEASIWKDAWNIYTINALMGGMSENHSDRCEEDFLFVSNDYLFVFSKPSLEIYLGVAVDFAKEEVESFIDKVKSVEGSFRSYEISRVSSVSYSEDRISLDTGKSYSTGNLLAKISSTGIQIGAANFETSDLHGALSLSGTQSGFSVEIITKAKLEIYITDPNRDGDCIKESFEVKFLDISDYYTMENLKASPEEFISQIDLVEEMLSPIRDFAAHITRVSDGNSSKISEIRERDKYINYNLDDEAYIIYLVKRYNIEKNNTLNKFIVVDRMFESIEDALLYADKIFRGH